MTSKVTELSIPLCIGEPDDSSRNSPTNEKEPHGTSFSRFVLPFAYKVETSSQAETSNDLFYEVNQKENLITNQETLNEMYVRCELTGLLNEESIETLSISEGLISGHPFHK